MLTFVPLAATNAGKMALHWLLAAFMCELLPHLQSARMNHGIAYEAQSSGNPDDTDMTVAGGDERLLACEVVETKERLLILGKDKPFWDYYFTKGVYYSKRFSHMWAKPHDSRSISCKAYKSPPKTSFVLEKLTAPLLPDDIIGEIASFDDSALHCHPCALVSFSMKYLENCSAPTTSERFFQAHKEVKEEGGYCFQPSWSQDVWQTPNDENWGEPQTLASCMELNSLNKYFSVDSNEFLMDRRVLASCIFESDIDNKEFIIESNQKIKENQEENLRLQTAVAGRKQDFYYLKTIFNASADTAPVAVAVEGQ